MGEITSRFSDLLSSLVWETVKDKLSLGSKTRTPLTQNLSSALYISLWSSENTVEKFILIPLKKTFRCYTSFSGGAIYFLHNEFTESLCKSRSSILPAPNKFNVFLSYECLSF